MARSNIELNSDQFGTQAAAYVSSAVHSGGADLDRLRAIVSSQPFEKALDLGTGGGHLAYALASGVNAVVAADISPRILAAVETEASRRGFSNIQCIQAPADSVPFDDGYFDLVVSRFSAHHWPDLAAGIREARRVLKPGGMAIFIDIVSTQNPSLDTHLQTVELLRDPSHVRDYNVAEWISALGSAGFDVKELERWRLEMEFSSWVARMNTSPEGVAAVRYVQNNVAAEVGEYFGIKDDGSFMLDSAWFLAD